MKILDPFTGTGTFLTRLLQLGIIPPENLEYKYHNDLFANEIVLLSYYIAAVNIESVFREVTAAASVAERAPRDEASVSPIEATFPRHQPHRHLRDGRTRQSTRRRGGVP